MTEDDKETGKATDAATEPGAPKPADSPQRAGGGATRRTRRAAPASAPPSPVEARPDPAADVTPNPLGPLPARRPPVWPD